MNATTIGAPALEDIARGMRAAIIYAYGSLSQKPADIPFIVLEEVRERLRPYVNGEPAEQLIAHVGHPDYTGKEA